MQIHGLQKMTLLDFPGRVACTVFLGGCDFRCPFCHNAQLLDGTEKPLMDDRELLSFLSGRRGLLDGVCFTGGEPMLRPDLPEVMAAVKELGFRVKLDTNGSHPERLRRMLESGAVDYVAMDIKNSPERYGVTVAIPDFDLTPVRESAVLLMEGDTDYEFRTTTLAQLHDESSFRGIGEWIRGAKRYFIQPFVDRDTVPYGGLNAPGEEELQRYLSIIREYVPAAELRGL